VNQNYRGLDLPIRNVPINLEQPVFFDVSDQLKSVLLVKPHGPTGGLPGADENPAFDLPQQVREQFTSDAPLADFRPDVGVADERDILDRLHSHDTEKQAVFFVPQNLTPAAISSFNSANGIYGSCQRSEGITPL